MYCNKSVLVNALCWTTGGIYYRKDTTHQTLNPNSNRRKVSVVKVCRQRHAFRRLMITRGVASAHASLPGQGSVPGGFRSAAWDDGSMSTPERPTYIPQGWQSVTLLADGNVVRKPQHFLRHCVSSAVHHCSYGKLCCGNNGCTYGLNQKGHINCCPETKVPSYLLGMNLQLAVSGEGRGVEEGCACFPLMIVT